MNFYALEFPSLSDCPNVTDYDIADPYKLGDSVHCDLCGGIVEGRRWLPPYRVKIEVWGNLFGDIVGPYSDLLVSEHFKTLYEHSDLKGIKYFNQVEILKIVKRDNKSRIRKEDVPNYFLARICRSRAAIDLIKSGFEDGYSRQCDICPECRLGSLLKRWKRVVFEPNTWGGEDIFVARGLPGTLFVSDNFKKLCEYNRMSDAVFIPIDKYAKDFYPWEKVEKKC